MPEKQDLEPLLNTQQNLLAAITSQGDGIDNKSLGILAVDVTLLIFIAGIDSGHGWAILGVVALLAVSLIFASLALQPKKYMGASVNLEDHSEYLTLERETLVLQLLSDTQEAIAHNKKVNFGHWRKALLSAAAAAIGAIGLFIVL